MNPARPVRRRTLSSPVVYRGSRHRRTAPASAPRREIARALLRSALLFAGAAFLGFALLVALFKLGVAGGVDILFYRGVVLCVVACALTVPLVAFVGRRLARAPISDAIAAGALSLGLNLSFLVLAPVTVDRSVSVFLLGYMGQHEPRAFTTREMEEAFRRVYLGDLAQIQRRMDEQERSGNLMRAGEGYALSPQGAAFLRTARLVAWMFDTDPRLLPGRARNAATAVSPKIPRD